MQWHVLGKDTSGSLSFVKYQHYVPVRMRDLLCTEDVFCHSSFLFNLFMSVSWLLEENIFKYVPDARLFTIHSQEYLWLWRKNNILFEFHQLISN